MLLYTHMQMHPCRNITTTQWRLATQFSKIYLSLYWKVVCEREMETKQNCNIFTPTLVAITAFLSRSPRLLNRGPGGSASLGLVPQSSIFSPTGVIFKLLNRGLEGSLCWMLSFSTASCLQLVSSPNCTELYNSSTTTIFLWASQIAVIQPIHGQGYTLLFFDQMHLLFTEVHFLFWLPDRVLGQYTKYLCCYLWSFAWIWQTSPRLLTVPSLS